MKLVLALLWCVVACYSYGAAVDVVPASAIDEPANLIGITDMHNAVRAAVDTTGIAGGPLPPMQWSPDLAALAAAWAIMCIDTTQNGLIDHSPFSYRTNAEGFSYIGENIYASTGTTADAREAFDYWASEKEFFTYPEGCTDVCGHYTQIVSRTSVALGCALATCLNLEYKGTLICQYGPGGNFPGAPY